MIWKRNIQRRMGFQNDMATLVLDNSALGVGFRKQGQVLSVRNWILRAMRPSCCGFAAGDEASFNFLVGKHHRAMIHFAFPDGKKPGSCRRVGTGSVFTRLSSQGQLSGGSAVYDLALPDRDEPSREPRTRHQARTDGGDDLSGLAG